MSDHNSKAYVRSEIHQGVTTIEFYHPQGNSLPGNILEALAREIHSAGHDQNTKVIVIRSGGDRAFCGGASFDELSSITTKDQGQEFFTGFADVINAIRKCPKFVIGRIHGKSVGGGVGLVAAMDYAIAAEGADVRLSELSIGFGPFVVGPVIERKIGASAFGTLAIDASHWRNADWAKRKGLFSELHPDTEGMDEAVRRLADNLSHANPEAMKELKKILWQGTDDWDKTLTERALISGRLALGAFAKNAIEKVKSKK